MKLVPAAGGVAYSRLNGDPAVGYDVGAVVGVATETRLEPARALTMLVIWTLR